MLLGHVRVLKDIVGSPCDSDDLEDCKLSGLWLTRRYRGVIVIAGRVLVVDDDEAIQDFICASLSDDGYEVMVASNGNAALEAVKTFQPSVILLDMRMPGMSGEGFLRRYEEIADYRVPEIALSASNQCREEILKLGASDYLAKPFNLADLMSCIEYWIQARQV
jgi:DNA-binding response OmpR family regulator